MRARGLTLLLAALAAAALAAVGVRSSAAAFTASRSVAANTVTVDRLANYFVVAPGTAVQPGTATPVAAGGVDTLALAFGTVPSARTFASVFTVRNTTATAQPAVLSTAGVPQVASAVFASTGSATATIAAGATAQVDVTTSPAVAGAGSGTLRLRLGSTTWLYRDYALTIVEAPEAPPSVTATARAAGAIAVAWGASATTTNLGGYDVYRGGVKVAALGSAVTSWTDTATSDGTAYTYSLRARSADASPLESLASGSATATADASAPSMPTATYVDNKNVADVITGSTEANATVTITRASPAATYTGSADGSGSYSIAVAISKGQTVTYAVTATDAVGNTSAARTVTFTTRS